MRSRERGWNEEESERMNRPFGVLQTPGVESNIKTVKQTDI